MKILIVSSCPTHPVTAGNRKAILNQVEIFRRLGHDVYFLYIYVRPLLGGDVDNLNDLKNYWGNHLFLYKMSTAEHFIHLLIQRFRQCFNNGYLHVDDYYPYRLDSLIRRLNDTYHFDCCIVNYYYLSKALLKTDIPKKGLYTHDYFAFKGILVDNKNVGFNTTANDEAKALQRAPHIFALNSEEAIYFSKLSPKSKIYNTYCYYQYNSDDYRGNKNLLFFSGDNAFNLNGLKWFLDCVFPEIVKEIPDVKLIIGGSICRKIGSYQSDNIHLIGFVEDPKDFYSRGDIVINPTYQGTGLKIKTFEGISYDKVVIAHPHSVKGIYNLENAPIFSSESPIEWAKFIKSVMCNRDKIVEIKKQDKDYIASMNEFIITEYKKFFNEK